MPVKDSSTADEGVIDQIGTKVTRTQWLDLSSLGEIQNLVGKRILIVDEVDDTRTTLEYAVKELEKDVEEARQKLGNNEKTEFSIFVLHVSDRESQDTRRYAAAAVDRYDRTRTSRRRVHCPRT